MSLSRAEQETVINRAADEKGWTVYSCYGPDVRKLIELAEAYGVDYETPHEDGFKAVFPKRFISFRKPLSEAQRNRASGLAKWRESNKLKKEGELRDETSYP